MTVEVHDPPLLPELQHLVEPPPPPSGLYSGSVSAGNSPVNTRRASLGFTTPARQRESLDEFRRDTSNNPAERSLTTSPQQSQRRGRGSISEVKSGFGSRIRTAVTERMRSTSRSGNKSPPTAMHSSPYETVLPPNPFNGGTSPVQMFGAGASPLSRTAQRGIEDGGRQQAIQQMGYMRNPREIRANMPPDALGQGGYVQPSIVGGHTRKASLGRMEGE